MSLRGLRREAGYAIAAGILCVVKGDVGTLQQVFKSAHASLGDADDPIMTVPPCTGDGFRNRPIASKMMKNAMTTSEAALAKAARMPMR